MPVRHAPPRRRSVVDLVGVAAPALAAAAAVVLHVLTAVRLDGRAPTDGEARFAAAVYGWGGGPVGAVGLPGPDRLAAPQYALVTALVRTGSVWDGVRTAGLVFGVGSALLVWAVLRRFGCGAVATALGVAVVGVTPPALALHASASGAAVAVPWLLVAGLLCWRGRAAGVAAAGAALLAALTAPLVGAVLLALAAHQAADRTLTGTLRPGRGVPLAAGLGGAAIGLGVAAAGPLAGQAAPPVTTRAALVGVVCGLVVVGAAWRVRWVRPLLGPAVLALAVLAVPGPGRAAAALVALALVALLTATVVDGLTGHVAAPVLWTAATAGTAVAAVAALPGGTPPPHPRPVALLAWAGDQQGPAALHADPLDRAELAAAGFPADRLRDPGAPVTGGDVVLLAAPAHCAPGTLLATLPHREVCGAGPVAPTPAERASRVRIGTALAGNAGLRLTPQAAALLRAGAVDPRLMIVLAALTAQHTLAVADFPTAALQPPGSTRCRVLVTAVDGAPAGVGPLGDWLAGQHAPYAPGLVRADPAGLVVGYGGDAPVGLLPAS